MGVTYVICPPEATSWHVRRDRFTEALAERWPHADITAADRGADDVRAVCWSLHSPLEPDRWLDGSLDHAGQASYLRGDLGLVAEYAVWLRGIDTKAALVLLSTGHGAVLDLLSTTTAEEVIDFFT